MVHARTQHPNAPLTPEGRHRMVACVLEGGWTIEATAERFQVDAKTVRKWRDRYLTEGDAGLMDRSSRPHRCPNRTPDDVAARVVELRRRRRWGADRIAHQTGVAPSTAQRILTEAGLGRLDRGDRVSEPVLRYVRDRPGELIHVNVKKLAAIPPGGGWRSRGRGYEGEGSQNRLVGYRFIHTAIDDRTRLAYSEIHRDEKAATAVGFWKRAVAWFAARGIVCERVLTDNGSCYKSGLWHRACAETGTTVKKTRPRRPQTNGKVERFHRILLEEWAYIRPWTSENQRHDAYNGFIHYYKLSSTPRSTPLGHPHQPTRGQPPQRAQLVATSVPSECHRPYGLSRRSCSRASTGTPPAGRTRTVARGAWETRPVSPATPSPPPAVPPGGRCR